MNRNKIFYLVFFFFCCSTLAAQDVYTNLQKYWRFRERLKNFVVPGNCFGCSMSAMDHNKFGKIEWSDATIHQGYYISMLATENKLLLQYNQQAQLQQNVRELFYALETMNRLDYWAEYRWEEFALSINHNGQPPPLSDLNGFFIRDDAPKDENYFSQQFNNKTVREWLNSSDFPLDGCNYLNKAVSAYTVGIDEGYGPREETIDQVIQLYIGLSLVSRLIHPSTIYIDEVTHQPKHFMDGETSLLQEAKNISNRITGHIQTENWNIVNPVMPNCSQGVCGNRSCLLGACGGGNATGLCFGFYKANCFIQQGGNGCNSDGQTDGNSTVWATTLRWNSLGDQDFKVLTLAAIGRVWDARTDDILINRCIASGAEHLPLLYNILYDNGSVMLPDLYYLNMLNSAWCSGNNGYEGPLEWRGQSRLLYGKNTDNAILQTHFSSIDYMLYLNLYILTHPDYVGNNYKSYLPVELCEEDITRQQITLTQQQHLRAANSITLNQYVVKTNSSTKASLDLKAGKTICFEKGTTFLPGAEVSAIIDTSLKIYSCRNAPLHNDLQLLVPSISLSIIPNPSDGHFLINAEHLDVSTNYRLIITNSMGQRVFEIPGITDGFFPLNLQHLANGIYIASLVTNRIVITAKVIIAGGDGQ